MAKNTSSNAPPKAKTNAYTITIEPISPVAFAVLVGMPGGLDDPAPSSVIVEVGDSSVPIRYFGWVDQRSTNFGQANSEAIRLVKEAIEAAGMELPEPIYRVRTEPFQATRPSRPTTTPDLHLGSDISLKGDPIIGQIDEEREASDDETALLDSSAPSE